MLKYFHNFIVPLAVVYSPETALSNLLQPFPIRKRFVPRGLRSRCQSRLNAIPAITVADVTPSISERAIVDCRWRILEHAPFICGLAVYRFTQAGGKANQIGGMKGQVVRMARGCEAKGESTERNLLRRSRNSNVEINFGVDIALVI